MQVTPRRLGPQSWGVRPKFGLYFVGAAVAESGEWKSHAHTRARDWTDVPARALDSLRRVDCDDPHR
ncbi:hypothetical protein R6Q57_004491 [Mikania cordata]